jgi:aspartyl-tRNA(Asn)/glutamyl-tRNA(Gln) amidotransferase subunit B
LSEYDAEVITSRKELADYFEAHVKIFPHPKQVANWIMGEVLREIKLGTIAVSPSPAPTEPPTLEIAVSEDIKITKTTSATVTLLKMVENGTISGKLAKTVFEEMIATGKDPEAIVQEKGLAQISDAGALEDQAREILAAHPKEVADYRAGKTKVMGFFVGQLMKKTKGQANPQLANEIFSKLLSD